MIPKARSSVRRPVLPYRSLFEIEAGAIGSMATDEVPAVGLSGALTPHYTGTLTGYSGHMGLDIFAVGGGVDVLVGVGVGDDLLPQPTSVKGKSNSVLDTIAKIKTLQNERAASAAKA